MHVYTQMIYAKCNVAWHAAIDCSRMACIQPVTCSMTWTVHKWQDTWYSHDEHRTHVDSLGLRPKRAKTVYTCKRTPSDLRLQYFGFNLFLWECSYASECDLRHPTADLCLRIFRSGRENIAFGWKYALTEIAGKHHQTQIGHLMTDSIGRLHVCIALAKALA